MDLGEFESFHLLSSPLLTRICRHGEIVHILHDFYQLYIFIHANIVKPTGKEVTDLPLFGPCLLHNLSILKTRAKEGQTTQTIQTRTNQPKQAANR